MQERDMKRQRILYHTIEGQVGSSEWLGWDSGSYGPLLTPVILERLSHYLRLLASRKLKDKFDIKELLLELRRIRS